MQQSNFLWLMGIEDKLFKKWMKRISQNWMSERLVMLKTVNCKRNRSKKYLPRTLRDGNRLAVVE